MNNHDKLILKLLLCENSNKFNGNKISKIKSGKFPNILEYISNRYIDSFSLNETLNRIKMNIDTHPKCPECGKYVRYKGITNKMFYKYCSNFCAQNSKETKEKMQNTCLRRYGVTNGGASKIAQNKIKETLLKHYGVDNPAKSEIIKQKMRMTTMQRYGVDNTAKSDKAKTTYKRTMQKKYGVDNSYQAKEVKDKIKKTLIERYGGDNPLKIEKFKQKLVNTCLKKYGVTNGGASKESLEKIAATKRKNHTFSSSKPEEQLYKDIYSIFPSVIRQHKESRYPYHCDFYIPELDMFIELQGSWTHGKHPYNSNSIKDQVILEQWKERSEEHPFYKTAIKVWTEGDVKKRNCAKEHNLNYIELFSKEDINLFLIKLKEYKENEKSI